MGHPTGVIYIIYLFNKMFFPHMEPLCARVTPILQVPAYEEVGFTQGSAGDEEEESGGEEEHPAVRGGRSR